MKRTVIVFGLLSGAVVSAIMAVNVITCYNNPEAMMDQGMIIGYLSMLIAFSMIYVGIKSYRDKQNNGVISFGKAFRVGLFITLIASTIYVIVWAIEYKFFFPEFMEKYTAIAMKQAEANGEGNLKEKAAEMAMYQDMYKNPLFFTLMTYAEILPVGLVVSLICAFILKRKNRKTVAVAV